ncbi:MAG: LysR family transcriptional regulator, partial [Eubacteriales bacterium]|nr:LysR family transcriptional regulator [Eubacteriales bacterium]
KAAKTLFITQPALSRAIKDLETEIGMQIFVRMQGGVILTHQGKEFLAKAQRLNEQYVALQEQYYLRNKPDVAQISLAAIRCVIFEKALIHLYNAHKEMEFLNFCMCEESIGEVIEHVYDGSYAIGLVFAFDDVTEALRHRCGQKGIAVHSLGQLPIYAQVGPDHPLVGKEQISMDDLRTFPCATMSQDEMEASLNTSHVRGYDPVVQKKRIVINDKSTMYTVLSSTDAYYIGLNLTKLRNGNTNIRYIPITDIPISYELLLLYLKQHVLSSLEKELTEDICRMVRELQAGG